MPYETTASLPVNIKKRYSPKAQSAFLAAFNGILAQTKNESRAFAGAHVAADKVDGLTPEKLTPESAEMTPATFREDATEASFWLDGSFREVTTEDGVSRAKVTVIKPGLSANNFFYSPQVLSGLVPLLEGAKAYADHETKSELKDRGSRSIRDLVGWYDNVSQNQDGDVNATLNFMPGNENLVEALKVNPSLMGLSINAKGRASRGEVGGKKAHIAEAFDHLYSTDLVTEAAAGGEVTRMVASVTMATETIEDNEEGESMTDEEKAQVEKDMAEASWLLAEMEDRFNVASYLFTERDATVSNIEATYRAGMLEDRLSKVPENVREAIKEIAREPEDVDRYLEALKNEPAEKKNDTTVSEEKPKAKPGDEGYTRHFC